MKYRNMPELVPRKGTSRKKRRSLKLISEHMFRENGEKAAAVVQQAFTEHRMFGISGITWDLTPDGDVSFSNLNTKEVTK